MRVARTLHLQSAVFVRTNTCKVYRICFDTNIIELKTYWLSTITDKVPTMPQNGIYKNFTRELGDVVFTCPIRGEMWPSEIMICK